MKRFYIFQALAVSLLVVNLSWGLALAQEQSNDSAPVDLTKLVKTKPDAPDDDSNIPEESAVESSPLDATQSAPRLLTKKDPSTIRLNSLGLERDERAGLGRSMWQGSEASMVLALMMELDAQKTPAALRALVHHIMVARANPPEGFDAFASNIITARLNWLASAGASHDLAAMTRQLPDVPEWDDQKSWLLLHDLMTRNDNEACAVAERKVGETLDVLWHQAKAFCDVIGGGEENVRFALDILQDSGLQDPVYFDLMRYLISGDALDEFEQTGLSALNMVLMDSARITIQAEGLKTLPVSYRMSARNLRHLSPQARRLLDAWDFEQNGSDVVRSWALLPRGDVSVADALGRLRQSEGEDGLELARLDAWQAIAAEQDDVTLGSLAFEALVADVRHSGIAALGLWLPLVERGAFDPHLASKIGPILGFAAELPQVPLSDEASAWQEMLTHSARPVEHNTLRDADAYDAVPLLIALGRPVGDIDWSRVDGPALTVGVSMPYATLKQIEISSVRRAEFILRLAVLLQDYDLADLSREDATYLTQMLIDAGMIETAQNLARDILISWGVEIHMNALVGVVSQS